MKDSTFCVYLKLLSLVWVAVIVLMTIGVCIRGLDAAAALMLCSLLGFGVTYSLCEYYDYKVWRNKRDRRNRYYSLQKD